MVSDWALSKIRTIPDFPKKGILFRDITTLLSDPAGFHRTVDELVKKYSGASINKVVGVEARGFILAGAIAHRLLAGFVPIRKPGKLPHKTLSQNYQLEYGTDRLEIHEDAINKGDNVLLVDDLIATGGTAEAAVKLIRLLGGKISAACFVIDLPDLGGTQKIRDLGIEVITLCSFSGH